MPNWVEWFHPPLCCKPITVLHWHLRGKIQTYVQIDFLDLQPSTRFFLFSSMVPSELEGGRRLLSFPLRV